MFFFILTVVITASIVAYKYAPHLPMVKRWKAKRLQKKLIEIKDRLEFLEEYQEKLTKKYSGRWYMVPYDIQLEHEREVTNLNRDKKQVEEELDPKLKLSAKERLWLEFKDKKKKERMKQDGQLSIASEDDEPYSPY